MQRLLAALALTFGWIGSASSVYSASLKVAPIGLDLVAPTAAAALKLENGSNVPANVQLRVFRWRQDRGREILEPTRDVVVSPPILKVKKGVASTIRVVRIKKEPIQREESYRILIDELPDPSRKRSGVVSILLRQSLPVFFRSTSVTPPAVRWEIQRRKNKIELIAKNSGDKRLRVSQLTLTGENGTRINVSKGLVGYVLGRSTMRFKLPSAASRLLTSRAVSLSAQGDVGQINARVPIIR